MLELLRLAFPFAALFTISLAVSYLATRWAMNRKRVKAPVENAKLRVRAAAGVYRARFLGEVECGWRMSAPLCRDSYVPLRVGEELTIEAMAEEGVTLFHTVVIDRDAVDHTFTIRRPSQTFFSDRRSESRRGDVAGHAGMIEGLEASLINVSSQGACLASDARVRPGDCVEVSLPWLNGKVAAYVMASEGSQRFKRMRLRFHNPIALPGRLAA